MTIEQLRHAIRAACELTEDTEVWVFGSQAILGQYPDAPSSLTTSVEVDLQPRNHPDRVLNLDGALGELSMFHRTHGFYIHGISLEAAVLPKGWEQRTIPLREAVAATAYTGFCVEAHDLAISKLVAYREKDRHFVRTLLSEGLAKPETLRRRIRLLPGENDLKRRIDRWVRMTAEELVKYHPNRSRPRS